MAINFKINYADKSNYGGSRKASAIKYIVIHYTANDGDSDEANGRFFKTKGRGASAHYFVDDDSVTISVPDLYAAWSVGGSRYSNYKTTGGASFYKICTNANSISIELCDTKKNGKYDVSEATLANAIELVKMLMEKYNIPISNVIRHFDVTGKCCPAYFATKDNAAWNEFKIRCAGGGSEIPISKPAIPPSTPVAPQTPVSASYVYNSVDYSAVFDANYYANKYIDLKNAFGNNTKALFNHFCINGMKEGRQAIATFNVVIYKNRYIDLQRAFGNDLQKYYAHYCTNGKAEGRLG